MKKKVQIRHPVRIEEPDRVHSGANTEPTRAIKLPRPLPPIEGRKLIADEDPIPPCRSAPPPPRRRAKGAEESSPAPTAMRAAEAPRDRARSRETFQSRTAPDGACRAGFRVRARPGCHGGPLVRARRPGAFRGARSEVLFRSRADRAEPRRGRTHRARAGRCRLAAPPISGAVELRPG